jgi:hypothetical protein
LVFDNWRLLIDGYQQQNRHFWGLVFKGLRLSKKHTMANDRQLDRQIDRKKERPKDRKTERQKDRKTDGQKDRKTERQKDRMTE